jgi:hypothetical protein
MARDADVTNSKEAISRVGRCHGHRGNAHDFHDHKSAGFADIRGRDGDAIDLCAAVLPLANTFCHAAEIGRGRDGDNRRVARFSRAHCVAEHNFWLQRPMTNEEFAAHVAALSHGPNGLRKAPMINLNTPVPVAAAEDSFAAVAALLALLSDPRGASKVLADLRDATREHREAAAAVAEQRREFEQEQKQRVAEFDQMAHSRTVAMDDAATAHAEAVQAWKAEMQVEKERIAAEKSAAAKDRAMAADLLERAQRRWKAFNETTA